MADRYPLIINPSANQIQEIPSGDNLNLGTCHIVDVAHINSTGVITATKFVGPMEGVVTGSISGTAGGLSGTPNIAVGNIDAATATFTGNVSIGGTLTYEDVKNVDSVGLVTARNGLAVTGGTATFSGAVDANQGIDVDGQTTLDNVNVSGVITATGAITSSGTVTAVRYYGSNADISGTLHTPTGVVTTLTVPGTGVLKVGTGVTIHAGVVTATKFIGDGSGLSGIDATALKDAAGNVKVQANPSGAIHTGVSTVGIITGATSVGATRFYGDGSKLTGIDATAIQTGNTSVQTVDTGSDGHIKFNTEGSEKLRILAGGAVGLGTTNPVSTTQLHVNKSWNNSTAATSSAVNLLVSNNANAGDWSVLGFQAGNTGGSAIYFGDTDSTNAGFFDYYHSDSKLVYGSGGAARLQIGAAGTVTPGADNTQDLGAPNARWANVYTGDLHLSNEGRGNDIDGTSGAWTMQEGSDDLFLINNKTGKKYKFNLTEVS